MRENGVGTASAKVSDGADFVESGKSSTVAASVANDAWWEAIQAVPAKDGGTL
ncbi:hypothetical protein Ddye_027923 [Dipteronia dyeriana]|uniref:Uncharacterized protein n=1 Tax=Dipteronia dyeriana TaxID=168575 RepID=A0AAD9WRW8_9ROSI|nr:hypothetical protein Ddye_027923 [Dipteronia dyeriana]